MSGHHRTSSANDNCSLNQFPIILLLPELYSLFLYSNQRKSSLWMWEIIRRKSWKSCIWAWDDDHVAQEFCWGGGGGEQGGLLWPCMHALHTPTGTALHM